MSITQTQALTRGLEADGWTRHEHVSRHPCWTKALPNKSGGTTQMFVFVGANGSARWTMARPLVGESRPIPEGRRQLLLWKGGFTPMSATQHDPA